VKCLSIARWSSFTGSNRLPDILLVVVEWCLSLAVSVTQACDDVVVSEELQRAYAAAESLRFALVCIFLSRLTPPFSNIMRRFMWFLC